MGVPVSFPLTTERGVEREIVRYKSYSLNTSLSNLSVGGNISKDIIPNRLDVGVGLGYYYHDEKIKPYVKAGFRF